MKELLVPFQILDEYVLILYLKLQYLLNQNPPTAWKQGHSDVLLIQGVSEHWNFLKTIGDFLNHHDYKIHIIPQLQDNTYPLETATKIVAKAVAGYSNLLLISHSKGGLIAEKLIADPEINPKIKMSITISTPYHGSHIARFHPASVELIPNSPVIKMCESLPVNKTKITALYSRLDNHVIPHSSLYLDGATNHQLDIVGHTRILVSPKTLDMLSKYI